MRIDANLLILLVAGLTSTKIIREKKHKRLKKYFVDDFDLLRCVIGPSRLCVLPNVATESHNLLKQHASPEKDDLLECLRELLLISVDNYVPNKIAASHRLYAQLGLTDTALYITSAPELVTDDFDLYIQSTKNRHQVKYFTYLRIEAGIIRS